MRRMRTLILEHYIVIRVQNSETSRETIWDAVAIPHVLEHMDWGAMLDPKCIRRTVVY